MLNATCTSSFNSLPHIFALKRGQTVYESAYVFVRAYQ